MLGHTSICGTPLFGFTRPQCQESQQRSPSVEKSMQLQPVWAKQALQNPAIHTPSLPFEAAKGPIEACTLGDVESGLQSCKAKGKDFLG